MTGQPWTGDAVSLVEAFRAGERTPVEEMEATLAAIERSELNAVSFVDADRAMAGAAAANPSLPFGGVPFGVKELDRVAGWPNTGASLALADRVAETTDTKIARFADAGGVPFGLTTSSEFGGVNQTWTRLNGATHNPWQHGRTPGGSSGGSGAGVAGGLFTIATGGDGGGSIRIPAGFCGLVGLKCTWGRIPRGPVVGPGNLTAVPGVLTRSVRDTARWFDNVNGFDARDPLSLPKVEGWESGLGTLGDEVRGLRVAVVPEFAGSVVAEETIELVLESASWLIAEAGLSRVELDPVIPRSGGAWSATGGLGLLAALGDRYPDGVDQLTRLMELGVRATVEHFDAHAAVQAGRTRIELNEGMASMFDQVDLVITATNPHTAFDAEGRLPEEFGGKPAKPINNGALTIPSNIYGNPAISIPIGNGSDGLPVGVQVLAPHHREPLLLELAHLVERGRPWPLVAPGA